MANSGRETVRTALLGVASVILSIAVVLLDKKAVFDRFPDWLVGVFVIVPLAIYLGWLLTHNPVRERLRLVYNRRPKMLLASLMICGAIVGAAFGTIEWWIITKGSAQEGLIGKIRFYTVSDFE